MKKLTKYILNSIYTLVLVLLFFSCKKENDSILIKSYVSVNREYGHINESYFKYDSKNRLIEKNLIADLNLIYTYEYKRNRLNKITRTNTTSGEDILTTLYYSNGMLDSIIRNLPEGVWSTDRIYFTHNKEKYISKTRFFTGSSTPTSTSTYEYGEKNELVSETISNWETSYVITFQYDNRSNITDLYSDGLLIAHFEYLDYKNPRHHVSDTYLTNVPVDYFEFNNGSYSNLLLSKKTVYESDTIIDYEYTYEYTFSEMNLPITAVATGIDRTYDLTYDYY